MLQKYFIFLHKKNILIFKFEGTEKEQYQMAYFFLSTLA